MSATLIKSFVALVTVLDAVCRLNHLVLQDQKHGVSAAAAWRRMPHRDDSYACRGSTSVVPVYALEAEHSIGHYFDLISAILGITLFPLGYPLHARGMRRARN